MSGGTVTREVSTNQGPARLLIDRADRADHGEAGTAVRGAGGSADQIAVLVLGHGAGGGPEAVDLEAMGSRLPAYGIEVVRVEQPWRLAGKRIASRPAALDEAWRQALAALRGLWSVQGALDGAGADGGRMAGDTRAVPPLVVGGRSAGARVACRTARDTGAVGCLALAFPLHPPGKADDPAKDRSGELRQAGVPTLVLQGERDSFGGPDAVADRVRGSDEPGDVNVIPVPYAGHELTVTKKAPTTQSDVLDEIVRRTAEWIGDLVDRK